MTDRDLTNLVLHIVELSEPEIFEAFHKGIEFSSLSISVKSSISNSRMGLRPEVEFFYIFQPWLESLKSIKIMRSLLVMS